MKRILTITKNFNIISPTKRLSKVDPPFHGLLAKFSETEGDSKLKMSFCITLGQAFGLSNPKCYHSYVDRCDVIFVRGYKGEGNL